MGLPDETSIVCDKCGSFNFDKGIIEEGKIYCSSCIVTDSLVEKRVEEDKNVIN